MLSRDKKQLNKPFVFNYIQREKCHQSAYLLQSDQDLRTVYYQTQSNIDSSNTDGSFTMANSNSFLSLYEVLPIAQKNKYLGKFSYFIVKLYVVCTH